MAPQAQAQAEISEAYNKGTGLMNEGKWQEASAVFDQLVKDWGPDAANTIGPAFGQIYYHHGYCLFILKNFKGAADSFKECYEKFADSKRKEGQTGNNVYHLKSLYFWALAEQRQKEYAGALKLYERFLAKNPKPYEDYQPKVLLIDSAFCHIELAGKTEDAGAKKSWIKKGTNLLQKAFDDFESLRLNEAGQAYITFLALAEQWVANSMVRDAMTFMDKNDGQLRWEPYEMVKYKFNLRLLKLGQDAAGGGEGEGKDRDLESLSLRFFSFIPRLEDAVKDLEGRLDTGFRTDSAKAKITEEISTIKTQIASGNNSDVKALLLSAQIHESKGNPRAAYAVYEYITEHYKQAKMTIDKKVVPYAPDALYHATRTAFSMGDLVTAQFHGLAFLKLYPGHKYEPSVQSMLLEYLFRASDFQACIDIAERIEPKLTKGTKEHDLCLFVRGGSYFFEGRFQDAVEPLGEHVEAYPKSPFRSEVTYYNASNQVKMLEWVKAAKLLDAWLDEFKDNPLRPLALLDRAICHYASNELPETLAKIDLLETKFKDHTVFPRALNLRGDVQSASGKIVEAETSYLLAKKLATEQGDASTVAEATTQLIATEVTLEKAAEAVAFYDDFINNHGGHYLEPQAVANALPALVGVGRGQDGLDKMEQMIIRLGQQKNADLEKAVTTYANNYIENYKDSGGAQKLVDRLKSWPQNEPLPAPVRAWLLITTIDILEDPKHYPTPPEAQINVTFRELMEMDRAELAPYPLQRIIVYLDGRGKSSDLIPFADEILTREGSDGKDVALYFKSVSLASSSDQANQEKAIQGFNDVIDKYQSQTFTDDAMHALGMLHMKRQEWVAADKTFFRYVNNKRLNKHNP